MNTSSLPSLQSIPLTSGGRTIAVLAIGSYLAGAAFGWIELVVLASGCVLGLLLAVPFVVGRLRLRVTRTFAADRVSVGDSAVSILSLENQTRRPLGILHVEERIAGQSVSVDVSGLEPRGVQEICQSLPTDRRGVHPIGPTIVAKSDPLGLMRREIWQADVDHLWVHPKLVTLPPLPSGFARDLEGPASEMSPAGDVSFHALRDYEPGDDHRHVHWLSSARTGALVVRQYVDTRLPVLTVLLDDRPVYGSEPNDDDRAFEIAVAIAGSLAMSSLRSQFPAALRIGDNACARHHQPVSTDDLLDHLTLASNVGSSELEQQVEGAIQDGADTSILVVVTGGQEFKQLLPALRRAKATPTVVVRVWDREDRPPATRLPGATVLDVSSLDEFVSKWTQAIGDGVR